MLTYIGQETSSHCPHDESTANVDRHRSRDPLPGPLLRCTRGVSISLIQVGNDGNPIAGSHLVLVTILFLLLVVSLFQYLRAHATHETLRPGLLYSLNCCTHRTVLTELLYSHKLLYSHASSPRQLATISRVRNPLNWAHQNSPLKLYQQHWKRLH